VDPTHATWYEPLTDADDIARAVRFVLSRPGFFLNTAGDLGLLGATLDAAEAADGAAPETADLDVEPLFIRGFARASV
jgi:hypothetical protein